MKYEIILCNKFIEFALKKSWETGKFLGNLVVEKSKKN